MRVDEFDKALLYLVVALVFLYSSILFGGLGAYFDGDMSTAVEFANVGLILGAYTAALFGLIGLGYWLSGVYRHVWPAVRSFFRGVGA